MSEDDVDEDLRPEELTPPDPTEDETALDTVDLGGSHGFLDTSISSQDPFAGPDPEQIGSAEILSPVPTDASLFKSLLLQVFLTYCEQIWGLG